MPILDGALDEGIPVIDVRHEQAAVHAADAYSRLNPGRLGCAVLTAGPGVTDGVTGIANAWRANSPLLVIGGQAAHGTGTGDADRRGVSMDRRALSQPFPWRGSRRGYAGLSGQAATVVDRVR